MMGEEEERESLVNGETQWGEVTPEAEAAERAPAPAEEQAAWEQEKERLLGLLAEKQEEVLRLRAEFENFRKRMARQQEEIGRRVAAEMLRSVLSIVDNLKRAGRAAEQASDAEGIREGLRLVLRQVDQFLERHGVQPIPAVGATFDPRQHEALAQEEREDVAEGTVLEELQTGYTYAGEVLRPALVKVARATSSPVGGEGGEGDAPGESGE